MAFEKLATTCQSGPLTSTKAVPAGAVTVTVAVSATTAAYQVFVTPNWNTTWWVVDGQTATQFIINFGTPAPDDGTGSIDWYSTGT